MANTTNKFLLTGLDFDSIKANLKLYLQGQSEFSDYNFEGSGFSVLLDTLALNTHYLGYYLNMVANEMFLDSASQRNSLVSLAKMLNYTPLSRRAATAVVDLVLVPTSATPDAKITIPKFFKFTTAIDGVSYVFSTNQVYSVDLDITDNTYKVQDVVLKEGLGYTFQFSVDPTQSYQRFVIPNPKIDTTELTVRVQASLTNTSVNVFNLADDVNLLTGESLVYFLQEGDDLQYEIYFGDNIIGKGLDPGNIVIVDYLVCSATAPNKASSFTAAQGLTGIQTIRVTTDVAAYGGAERESIESVRFSATKSFESQNRAVTVQDYKTVLVERFPNVQNLSVWGGEDSDPPTYGKVFLALKPVDGYVITESVKDIIKKEILQAYNVVTVIPEIVDPEYIFLEINSVVKYNSLRTTLSEDQLKQLVLDTIASFNTGQINTFDQTFRYTYFTRLIDLCDTAITNNLTNIRVQKRFVPYLGIFQNQTLRFTAGNPIKPRTVSSTKFVVTSDPTYDRPYRAGDVFGFDDDGEGNLRVYKNSGSSKIVVKNSAGTVDYDNGLITITNFLPASIVDNTSSIKVSAEPVYQDITPLRNYIITIDPLDVKVTMQVNPRNVS